MPDEELIDRIYEAAFVPELWPATLERIALDSGSASGSVLVFPDAEVPPRYKTTPVTEAALHTFIASGQWRESRRVPFMYPEVMSGSFSFFFYVNDLMSPDRLRQDAVASALRELSLGEQITTVIPLPDDEALAITFERGSGEGRHHPDGIVFLDRMRRHLARAGLISARLGLERAQSTVSALERINLPAAVLSRTGRVMASNALLDTMTSLFLPTAFGGIALSDRAANELLRQVIEASALNVEPAVRSIPVKAASEGNPVVIHVLPLRRSAHDVFTSAELLIAATVVSAGNLVPPAPVLAALFDLSPSETRLAVTLAQGHTLKAFAIEASVTFGTARKYLDRIYLKTGTHQQSELVALLKSAHPVK